MAEHRVIKITSASDFPRLLDDAREEPILFERDGIVFRLLRQSDDTDAEADVVDRRRRTSADLESLADVQEKIRQMVGNQRFNRLSSHDSTETVRHERIERSADLLRASGSLTREDPIWWDLAYQTMDEFKRVSDAIYGDRVLADDSTDILRKERELRSSNPIN